MSSPAGHPWTAGEARSPHRPPPLHSRDHANAASLPRAHSCALLQHGARAPACVLHPGAATRMCPGPPRSCANALLPSMCVNFFFFFNFLFLPVHVAKCAKLGSDGLPEFASVCFVGGGWESKKATLQPQCPATRELPAGLSEGTVGLSCPSTVPQTI